LFEGLVAVFIGHHGDNHEQEEKLEKGRYEGVEMPDVRKVEYTLLSQVELYGSNVKFDRCDQGYGGEQDEIRDDQHLAGPAVPEFMKFYVNQSEHDVLRFFWRLVSQ
jgi:hypothetical protein